jgi:2-C-methyl-D-erythritol 2,4-cyclodiphosphate synthase
MRVGNGYDVHAFGPGDKIVIGGVLIPHHRGLIAHSDGDVLLHALCDALLGAAGLGDIGAHFPDSDSQYKNADSRALLRMVYAKLKARNWRLLNTDMTVVAQSPRMSPYIAQMRDNIAADLNVDAEQVNVKATTTEKLGFTGREEGIAAYAVVLLEQVLLESVS